MSTYSDCRYQVNFEVAEDGAESGGGGFYGSAPKETIATGTADGIANDEGGVAFSVMLDEPTELEDTKKYHLIATISKSGGGSTQSKAGNSGLRTLTGDDGVTFTISSSRFSNNGTGDSSGQVSPSVARWSPCPLALSSTHDG